MSTQAEPRFVLAALDGSAADQLVVQWALGEAAHRGLPLRLVHVAAPGAAGPGPDPQEVIAAGRGIAAAGSADVRIEDRAPSGPVAPVLLSEAATAALVVLGSGRRVDTGRLWVGSVAVHVTTHAPCPVVVARAALEGEPTSGPNEGRVVVGTDGSPVSEEALGFAFEEASWRAAGLTVVHAFDEKPGVLIDGDTGRSERERQAARTLAESLRPWREKHPDVPVVDRLVADHPVRALLEASAGAMLLVVGSHGRGQFTGMLLGSVSQALLRHAATSIAVVRPQPSTG